jgi:hypothetical protein
LAIALHNYTKYLAHENQKRSRVAIIKYETKIRSRNEDDDVLNYGLKDCHKLIYGTDFVECDDDDDGSFEETELRQLGVKYQSDYQFRY